MTLLCFLSLQFVIYTLYWSFCLACGSYRYRSRHAHLSSGRKVIKYECQYVPSLVPRHQIFRARPAALSKNRVWTLSLVKLGRNYTSVVSCCRTNQIAQVK